MGDTVSCDARTEITSTGSSVGKSGETETAAGPTRETSPSKSEVTEETDDVDARGGHGNAASPLGARSIDFAHMRSQLPIERVLELLNHRDKMVVQRQQLRGLEPRGNPPS